MTMHHVFVPALSLMMCASTGTRAPAQTAGPASGEPAIVARLLGTWRGAGIVTGRASEMTMTWERAVGGAFLHLRFRNAMAASATRPAEVFEARGYYRVVAASGTTAGTGTWIDSRGLILPVRVTVESDALTSDWGGSGTETGRTVYRLTSATTLEVVDSVRTATGEYREFGRTTLTRQ
jgi:ribosomal protein S16